VRQLASLLVLALSAVLFLTPNSAASSPATRDAGSGYTVLQMNLCLSGAASCYPRTAYPAILHEAAAHVVDQAPDVVTINEACSGDAAELARRTGYHLRFAAVLAFARPIRCAHPSGRGVFGLAVLTKDRIETSHTQAFVIQAGAEQRRWLCATTSEATACTAHLGLRGSADARYANGAQCRELRGLLEGYDEQGATIFGGDVNRRDSCAPETMWTRTDSAAYQSAGIQHVYGSWPFHQPSVQVAAATHTDHDFMTVRLRPAVRQPTVTRLGHR